MMGPGFANNLGDSYVRWVLFAAFGWGLSIILAIALVVVLTIRPARAHGDAQWIADAEMRNMRGELCCGENDCMPLADEEVKDALPDGVDIYVRWYPGLGDGIWTHVPEKDVIRKSQDGRYWRCIWGGSIKCVIGPPYAN